MLRNGGGFVEVDDRARNEERERMVGQAKVRPGREEMEKPVLKTVSSPASYFLSLTLLTVRLFISLSFPMSRQQN